MDWFVNTILREQIGGIHLSNKYILHFKKCILLLRKKHFLLKIHVIDRPPKNIHFHNNIVMIIIAYLRKDKSTLALSLKTICIP